MNHFIKTQERLEVVFHGSFQRNKTTRHSKNIRTVYIRYITIQYKNHSLRILRVLPYRNLSGKKKKGREEVILKRFVNVALTKGVEFDSQETQQSF